MIYMNIHAKKRSEEVLPDKKPTPEELESIRATKPVASLASLVNESPTLQVGKNTSQVGIIVCDD